MHLPTRHRHAFTLVELLVVIGIMITLMALIMGGVMLAKRSAQRAKAVSLLGAVASAIDQYRSLNSIYPELLLVGTADVYEGVFGPRTAPKAATAVGTAGWRAANEALTHQLGSLVADHAIGGVLIDPWGTPLRYRPAKWYPYEESGTPARVDAAEPPGLDTYQLWSAGPDTSDDANPGEGGDDIPHWTKR